MCIFWRLINGLDLGRLSEGTTKGTALMQIHAKQKSVPFSKAWETNLFRAGSERPKIGKTAFSPLSLLLAPEDSFHPLFPPSLDEARRQGANYQTKAERGNEHTKLSTEPAGQTPGWWLGGTKAAPFPQDCPVPSVVPSPGSQQRVPGRPAQRCQQQSAHRVLGLAPQH